jgi:hypothetical protein
LRKRGTLVTLSAPLATQPLTLSNQLAELDVVGAARRTDSSRHRNCSWL